MELERHGQGKTLGPKTKNYDEGVDEPETLIESEPVDVETATPAEANLPVEQVEDTDKSNTPAFQE